MANDDYIMGLRPLNLRQDAIHVYEADSAGGRGEIFIGQPVAYDASGLVGVASASGGTTGNAYLGVALGFLNAGGGPVSDTQPFIDTGGTARRFVMVADDPNQEFIIQEDTGGTALILNNRGNTVDLLYTRATSGNTTTGFANLETWRSTVSTTMSGAVLLLRLQENLVNSDGTQNAAGNFAKWVVRLTNHQRRGQSILNVAL